MAAKEHKNPVIKISEKDRKEIYKYRALKKEVTNNPLPKTAEEIIENDIARKLYPKAFEVIKMYDKRAFSDYFAMSEIQRFHDHCESVHGKGKSCANMGCLEDLTMEDAKEFASTILSCVKTFFEDQEKKEKDGSNGNQQTS